MQEINHGLLQNREIERKLIADNIWFSGVVEKQILAQRDRK